MSIEAMKLALDELRYVLDCINKDKIPFDGDDFHEAIKALEEALAKQEQGEPLGYIASMALNDLRDGIYGEVRVYHEELGGSVPIYTTPQPKQEQNFCPRCGKRTNDIHTCTPPKK